jgi:hypothetical protein
MADSASAILKAAADRTADDLARLKADARIVAASAKSILDRSDEDTRALAALASAEAAAAAAAAKLDELLTSKQATDIAITKAQQELAQKAQPKTLRQIYTDACPGPTNPAVWTAAGASPAILTQHRREQESHSALTKVAEALSFGEGLEGESTEKLCGMIKKACGYLVEEAAMRENHMIDLGSVALSGTWDGLDAKRLVRDLHLPEDRVMQAVQAAKRHGGLLGGAHTGKKRPGTAGSGARIFTSPFQGQQQQALGPPAGQVMHAAPPAHGPSAVMRPTVGAPATPAPGGGAGGTTHGPCFKCGMFGHFAKNCTHPGPYAQ